MRQKEAGAKNLEAFTNGNSLVSQKIDELAEAPAPEPKPEIKPEPAKPVERRTDTKLANAFGTNRSYVAAAQKARKQESKKF